MTTTEPNLNSAAAHAQRVRDIHAALAAAEVSRAIGLAKDAIASALEDPLFYNLVAHDLEEQGRYAEALAQLKRAYDLAPRDVIIINAVGICLTLQGRAADAIKVFDAALAIDPNLPQSYYNKGDALALTGDFIGARLHFERAIELFHDYAEPLAGLASLALGRGEVDEAVALSERALALNPGLDLAIVTYAECRIIGGDAASAEARLSPMLAGARLKPVVRAKAESLLGDALDAQGRADEAFAAYARASLAFQALHAGDYARGAPSVLEMARWLLKRFEASDPSDWAAAPAEPATTADGPHKHVFFVGFPRSGTTLLEQILASHPNIVTLDEREALVDSTKSLFVSDQAFDRLAKLDASEAAGFREAYWRRAREYCPDLAGKVFIDKLPLNSVRLPLVAKLFPGAKVLFALRDPRDVVLSCFRRRFGMNHAMYQFVTLEGAAAYYDAVMQLVEQYSAKLPLNIHYVRYENVVEDLRSQVEAVCQFIDVAWDDSMLSFAETARGREIRTPSARQVRRGLYREGVGQWRAYAAHLAPVMPLLAPWVEKFGYPAE